MNCLQNFTAGDSLAAAKQFAVIRIPPDRLTACVKTQTLHPGDPAASGRKVRVRRQPQICGRLLGKINPELIGTGQTGSLDPDQTPEAGSGMLDDKAADAAAVGALRIRPERCKGTDDVFLGEARENLPGESPDKGEARFAHRPVDPVLPLRGAEQQAALHGRNRVEPFPAVFWFHLDDVRRMRAGIPVKNQIVAGSWVNADIAGENEPLNLIGLHAGAVDNRPGEKIPLCGDETIAVLFGTNGEHTGIPRKLRPVLQGVFTGGDAELPGVDRSGGRRIQGTADTGVEAGFHGFGLPAGDQREIGHTALQPFLIFRAEHGVRLRPVTEHQRAAAGEGNVQLLAQPAEGLVPPNGHRRLQSAGLVVITGIDDRGIGPGDAGTDILPGFQKKDGSVPAAEVPGGKAAEQTSADDGDIETLHLRPGR